MKEGLLITFEGGEGAGKTTLIEKMFRFLTSNGFQVLKTREPGGTFLGEKIRTLVLEARDEKVSSLTELALFLASRAQHVNEVILPALGKGIIVLCDRFNDSSIAYQGIARNLGKKEVSDACSFFSQHLKPDITFYLDIDPSVGMARVKKSRTQDRIEQEDFSFHNRVRNAFLEIAKDNPKRIHVLDATQTPETVYKKALECLTRLLEMSR